MKRLLCLLLALTMALGLFACGKKAPSSPDRTEDEPPENPVMPTHLETLDVEFSVPGHDPDALLALRQELPALLIGALADESVIADEVNITFGPSADATWQAVRDGGVDIAFLPSEVYLLHGEVLPLIAVENAPVLAESAVAEDCPSLAPDDVFFENAVLLSPHADEVLRRALPRALAALCADADGFAALSRYGSGAYLVSPDPETLLAPYRAYLVWKQEKDAEK